MTKFLKSSELNSNWFEIDAKNAVVGRLATIVSKIIRGKNKTTYTPHMDHGDFVVVKNIEQAKFTGKKFQEKESKKLQRAGAVIAVLSTPLEHPSIPQWEMQLSSGAVCMNLLACAQSMNYAIQWLTEWYAYNDKMLTHLGGKKGIDRISGFIYIGHKIEEPIERKRPDPFEVVTFL